MDENQILGNAKALMDYLKNSVEEITEWLKFSIQPKSGKQSSSQLVKLELGADKGIYLRYSTGKFFQCFNLFLRSEAKIISVISKVEKAIANFDPRIVIEMSYHVKSLTESQDNSDKIEKRKVDMIIEGIIYLMEVLDKKEWGEKKTVAKKMHDLFKSVENADQEKIELLLNDIIDQLTNPAFATAQVLQDAIDQSQSFLQVISGDIQQNSQEEIKLLNVCKDLGKKQDNLALEQKNSSEIESESRQKLAELAACGELEALQNLVSSLKQASDNIAKNKEELYSCSLDLENKKRRRSEIKSKILLLQRKKSAIEQRIQLLGSVQRILSTSIEEVFQKIEKQKTTEIGMPSGIETKTIPDDEKPRKEIEEEKDPVEEDEKKIPQKQEITKNDIFSEYSKEEKNLLLAINDRGTYSGIHPNSVFVAKRANELGIKKSELLIQAAKGVESLNAFLDELKIRGDAIKFIENLKKVKTLDEKGRINFSRIKELARGARGSKPKKPEIVDPVEEGEFPGEKDNIPFEIKLSCVLLHNQLSANNSEIDLKKLYEMGQDMGKLRRDLDFNETHFSELHKQFKKRKLYKIREEKGKHLISLKQKGVEEAEKWRKEIFKK